MAVAVLDMMVVVAVVLVPGERDQHQLEHTQYQQPFKSVQVEWVLWRVVLHLD